MIDVRAPIPDPLREVAEHVTAAASAVRGEAGKAPAQIRLERPKHAAQGDFSTNAAMLLAPALKLAPRAIAERISAELASPDGGGAGAHRGRRSGLFELVPQRPLVSPGTQHGRERRGPARGGWRRAGRADPDRVRVRQPDRAARGRQRAPRRLRRRAGSDPRTPRAHRGARVLLQRRRQPDSPARRLGAGPGSKRRGPRGRLSGRVRARARRGHPRRRGARRRRGRARRRRSPAGADQDHPRALRRAL